ncbi:uncharacterized protein B0I36DRAFT_369251 [Microdochium trichocladiopsis]|uniref:ABC1 atypical kinase-like domain-containing protein n=1 Tax=Microdochium trichocladiopsis TaxID=1682393 RepID=A0A9P8XUY5_9PEZI|nr:uncharacterized protein B0I36DRAFT_369251 [Microdochium trichocladiopsis]KAH7014277.1 hypothetical protein B0I36DRAFT_369251 [Microdochium trichocladiopsis]
MEFVSTGNSHLRILAGSIVKYITIPEGTLTSEDLEDLPFDFQNILPPMDYTGNWQSAIVARDELSGELVSILSSTPLPGVRDRWCSRSVDFLSLKRVRLLAPQTAIFTLKDSTSLEGVQTAAATLLIGKMARFGGEILYMETETRAYRLLNDARQHQRTVPRTPRFLAHIEEGGRIIGMLLEKVEGRPACESDVAECAQALRELFRVGILQTDCNRYNFLVNDSGHVTIIDFGNVTFITTENAAEGAAMLEEQIEGLEEQFRDTSGAGTVSWA